MQQAGLKLVERDYLIMQTINKFRFCLGRQIKILAEFSGQRACDRRLAKLIEAGYIERKHFIYGVPSLYFVTPKAQKVFNLDFITQNVRIEQIVHDISVIDTAIYFIHKNVTLDSITTERELKHLDGFGRPRHRPDFIYTKGSKTYCVEVELSVKKQTTLAKNTKDNYLEYDSQKWVVPSGKVKIMEYLKELKKQYDNIEIIPLEMVTEYVKEI